MQFSKDELKQKFQLPLSGLSSHLKMAPPHRAKELVEKKDMTQNAQKSAVLILFFHEQDVLKLVVIRRSDYVGIHAGQIAFPGGRFDEEDVNVETTALREIEEEIGIPRMDIEIIGRLSDIYVPPSNFLISVFVGFLDKKPIYHLQKREVAEVIEISLKDLFEHGIVKEKDFYVSSVKAATNAPYYDITNAPIWGASAMVMSELIDMLKS